MELFRSFEERARKLVEDARRLADESGVKAKAEAAAARIEAARDAVVPASVRERVEALKGSVQEKTDQAALALAARITALRGVETTPEQVKRVAARIGVALLAAGAAELISEACSAEAEPASGEPTGGEPASGGEQGAGSGGDPMDGVHERMARQGTPINIQTTVVDGDGCVLDAPG